MQVNYRTDTTPEGDPALVPLSEVSAEIRDEHRGRAVVRGEDFTVVAASFAHSDAIPTSRSGALEVVARLDRGDEAPLELGRVRLELREDWVWVVTMWFTDEDPTIGCFGCMGAESFPLPEDIRRSPADSLWLVRSGNSISSPVVF